MNRLVPSALAVLTFTVAVGGCDSTGAPAPGDQWTRPADGVVMVYVPTGKFEMGSEDSEVDAAVEMCNTYYQENCMRAWFEVEQPAHTVELSAYWIDQTEVTNAQYRMCVEAGACQPPASGDSDTRMGYYDDPAFANYPVVHVNWQQASAYCR